MKDKLNQILQELRSQLTTLYRERLVQVILYGSQARGDAEPGSDIDVLIVLKGDINPSEEISHTGHIVASLSLENNVVISCAFISEALFKLEQSPFLLNIRREGVLV